MVLAELTLAQDTALPPRENPEGVREETEGVIRGQDRQTDHVAEDDEKEEALQPGVPLAGLLDVFVREHPVEELARRLPEAPADRLLFVPHAADASTTPPFAIVAPDFSP